MAWVKLDDRFWSNRKVRKAGSSISVYVLALSWSADELTDGMIPCEELDFVCTGIEDAKHHAERLVEVGLFDLEGDVYVIPDFLEFNESADTIRERREKDRLRKAKGGRATSKTTPDGQPTDSERNPAGVRTESGSPDPTRPDPTRPKGKELLADDGSAAAAEIPPNPEDQRICDHLADAIEIRTQKRPKQSAKWVEAARLLRERGSTDWDQPAPVETDMILRAIDWAMGNEFWATNIRSPNALRKHWARLVDQSLQEKRTGHPPENPGAGVDLYDQLVESGHMT